MKRDFLIGEVSYPTTLWESFLTKVKELLKSSVSDQADTNNDNNINHKMNSWPNGYAHFWWQVHCMSMYFE